VCFVTVCVMITVLRKLCVCIYMSLKYLQNHSSDISLIDYGTIIWKFDIYICFGRLVMIW
jgi:hypothetical protein